MKVALVHDWITGMRGGEKCLEALCELYPEADLHTLVHAPGSASATIEARRIHTSPLQRFPRATRWYRYYLPFMPAAVEALDLLPYDLVISVSHCVAKGVITRPGSLHVSYVNSPMRYVWDQWPSYFPHRGFINRWLVPPLLTRLRTWDVCASSRVDRFVANSSFIASRIQRYYRRDSEVVHPPVDTDFFDARSEPEDYYLLVSALVPYKRVDLAVQACTSLGRRLVVVGQGPCFSRLKKLAGPTVEFRGRVSDSELRALYAGARAMIHCAVEDFGLAMLESNACGRPVIALSCGGARDVVVPVNPAGGPRGADWSEQAPTGVFFDEQSPGSLAQAVEVFEDEERHASFQPELLREHALGFSRERYKARMRAVLDDALGMASSEAVEESAASAIPSHEGSHAIQQA